jgi:chemotaxis protein methyltransferase CheR
MIAEDAPPDPEFEQLIAKIAREQGFGCARYKEKCVRRRIAVRMRARAVHTFRDYAAVLDSDGREWELLLDALTINVTKLFRNTETFDAIGRLVVPELCALPRPRVWSAGCASGEEPYSLALLFHRHAEQSGDLRGTERVHILGTDVDRRSLALAETAAYGEPSLGDLPTDVRAHYFPDAPPARIPDAVRAMVTFERRDLLEQPAPAGPWNLITCRNVVIYFGRETQEMLFSRFRDALAPGGFLVLGKVETLLGPARSQFAPVEARERIFRRL